MVSFVDAARYGTFKALAEFSEPVSGKSVREHLLIACKNKTQSSGQSPFVVKSIQDVINSLPDDLVTRDDVTRYIQIASTTTQQAIFAILGWGKIGPANFQKFLSRGDEALERVVEFFDQRRRIPLARREFYEQINAVLKSGGKKDNWLLYGISPAYYTKLIFFFTRSTSKPGYIMDQFTARSMNYLCGVEFIRMSRSGLVESSNNADAYELFCQRVEELALDLRPTFPGITPEQVEIALFSPNSRWRKHVKQYDKHGQDAALNTASIAAKGGRTKKATAKKTSAKSPTIKNATKPIKR